MILLSKLVRKRIQDLLHTWIGGSKILNSGIVISNDTYQLRSEREAAGRFGLVAMIWICGENQIR